MPLEVIDLSGSPARMGRHHGEALRDSIREFVEIRIDKVRAKLGERSASTREGLLDLGREHLAHHRDYDAVAWDEFSGIAEGAGVLPEALIIANGITDYVDVARKRFSSGGGCTSFVARPDATEDGTAWLGQTWDMHSEAEAFVVVFRRKPDEGPGTLSLTAAGCLSLIGISENGLAVGTNNMVSKDARLGVTYLFLIHSVLSGATCFDEAVARVSGAHRASGHNYLIASASGGEVGFLEVTGTDHELFATSEAVSTHANYYQTERLHELSQEPRPKESQPSRECALAEELASGVTTESVEAGFRREELDPNFWPGKGGNATCATVLCLPARGEMWACLGRLAGSEFERIAL